jgi:UDP-3-O-[3-hydroxymyristoyl] glucosamine N-acyltransferase
MEVKSELSKRRKMHLINYIAPDARIGKDVRIWNFVYVGSGSVIGDSVQIGSLSHIDYGGRIGRGTKIEGLVYIPPLSRIGKDVFIGPSVVLTNDPYPPSKRLVGVTIRDNAVICARAVIKAGIKIGEGSVVAMGSVVTRDVPRRRVVMGTPAKVVYTKKEYDRKRNAWISQKF